MPKRIAQCTQRLLAVTGVLLVSGGLSADVLGPIDGWKFDIVHLRTGRIFQGLKLSR